MPPSHADHRVLRRGSPSHQPDGIDTITAGMARRFALLHDPWRKAGGLGVIALSRGRGSSGSWCGSGGSPVDLCGSGIQGFVNLPGGVAAHGLGEPGSADISGSDRSAYRGPAAECPVDPRQQLIDLPAIVAAHHDLEGTHDLVSIRHRQDTAASRRDQVRGCPRVAGTRHSLQQRGRMTRVLFVGHGKVGRSRTIYRTQVTAIRDDPGDSATKLRPRRAPNRYSATSVPWCRHARTYHSSGTAHRPE